MFNPIFTPTQTSQVILNRLQRLQTTLRALVAYTKVDYQAAVYSAVNAILNLGNKVLPGKHITPEGPAVIGDIETNLQDLNIDGNDIADEVSAIELELANLFNLSAGVQNNLRQVLRELIFKSSNNTYIEAFINDHQIESGSLTGSVDFNAGCLTSSIISDTIVPATQILVGPSSLSSGDANTSYDPSQLQNPNNKVDNLVSWQGPLLEIHYNFDTPVIINRLIIKPDDYQGLDLISLTSSPDGLYYDAIDPELTPSDLHLDATSGKYSGDSIIDFNPRYTISVKMIFADSTGRGFINLRGIELHAKTYAATGGYRSNPIQFPNNGTVRFDTLQRIYPQLTTLVHQISYDHVHFNVIQPGDLITLNSSPFWYKVDLNRLETNFSGATSPLASPSGDPTLSANYTVSNITTVNLTSGTSERTISFSSVTGSIVFNEILTPNTLSIYFGSVLQSTSSYTFVDNTLTLTTLPQSNVTVQYQTSTLGVAGLGSLQNYFSPYLFKVTFNKI